MKILATMLTSAAFLALVSPAMADDVKAQTGSAGGLTDHSAVLRGQLSASGLSLSTYFQYGQSSYDFQTAPASVLFSGTLTVKSGITGLAPNTKYHYRIVATGLFGTTQGGDVSFTTNATGTTPSGSAGGVQVGTTTVSTDDVVSTDTGGPADLGDDSGATPQSGETPAAPAEPELGQKVVAGAASGTVGVKSPGASGWSTLAGNAPVPVGSMVDARRGAVRLVTALPGGATQTGTFHGAMFQVRQAAGAHGMTDLVLHGGSFAACKAGAQKAGVTAAGHRSRVVRRLWGSDHHGRFRTRGSNSIATVRGTQWVTTDRCDGTLTSVKRGTVSVRDLRRHKTVTVKAGHSYLARAR
jgi:hypothetical protein